MNFAQYVRIETLAGGIGCTDCAFIRALHSRLSAEGKNRANREWRHQLIREGLAYKRKGI
jgi:hypothetical protein